MNVKADQLRREFGPDAVFTRVGDITLVHLDRPAESVIRERIAEVRREAEEPIDDCPLCEMLRHEDGQIVVYPGDFLPEEN